MNGYRIGKTILTVEAYMDKNSADSFSKSLHVTDFFNEDFDENTLKVDFVLLIQI